MAWYWIVLLIMAYFVVGATLTGLMTHIDEFNDEDIFPFMILMWPILAPILLIILLCHSIIEHLRA